MMKAALDPLGHALDYLMPDFKFRKLSDVKYGVSSIQDKHHGYDVQPQKAMIDGAGCLLCCCVVHERSLWACRFGGEVPDHGLALLHWRSHRSCSSTGNGITQQH